MIHFACSGENRSAATYTLHKKKEKKILIETSHIYDLHPCASPKENLLLPISNKSENQLSCSLLDR